MKTCPKCSTEFEDKFNFCRNDGTALQAKAVGVSCPKCGREIEQWKKFCRYCGARLEPTSEAAPAKVEKPQIQEVVSPQQNKSEPSKAVHESQEKATEKIEKQLIHQEESQQQSITKHESPTEAAERNLKDGNYRDAIAALEPIVKKSPENQEVRLLHLLASIRLYNIYGYEKQIESIKSLSNFSEKARSLAREIFLIRSEEARKRGQEEETREYQRLASRVILGQPLAEPAPETKAQKTPAQREQIKPFPGRKVENIAQSPHRPVTSAPEKISELAPEVPPTKKKRASVVSITVGIILGIAGVIGGGLAAYYAKSQGVSITSLFGKASPGKEQTGREVKASGKTDVAQVLAAEELGFRVWGMGAADANRRESVLSEKIESQLDSLRNSYRQQIQVKPGLMGSITLQLTISPSGQVTKVEESSSQIKDAEFKKSVVEEAYKWRFPEASLGLVKVNYPLLFLPPGMDVATLVKWEQSIAPRATELTESPKSPSTGEGAESSDQLTKPASPPSNKFAGARRSSPPLATTQRRFAETKVSPSSFPSPQQPLQQPLAPQQGTGITGSYEVLYPTSVFREPRENSQRVASIDAGTKVNVVGVQGDWLEVRSKHGNPPGFIKKDSAVPATNR